MNETVNRDAKDVLAKVLAAENLTIIHKASAKTARFNPDTRVLTLPIYDGQLKSETINMLIGHEVGHALWSPGGEEITKQTNYIDPNNTGGAMRFLNIVEDIRIERRVKNRYTGLAKDFKIGYQEILDRNLFGIKGKDVNSFSLIDRINIFFKAGDFNLGIKFSEAEMPLVRQASKADTWTEVVESAKALYDWSSNHQSDKDKDDDDDTEDSDNSENSEESEDSEDSNSSSSSDEQNEGESGDSEDENQNQSSSGQESEDSNDFDSDADDSEDSDGDSDKSDKPSKQSKTDSKEKSTKNSKSTPKDKTTAPPDSQTQATWEENEESIVDSNAKDKIYISIPDVDLKAAIASFDTFMREHSMQRVGDKEHSEVVAQFKRFKRENKEKINYLVNEFNRRKAAENRSREQQSRTGMLNTGQLYAYKFADDIFKVNITRNDSKNHSMVFFLDGSCSMQQNFMGTVQQLLCQVMFCRAVGIPFEGYGFGLAQLRPNKLRMQKNTKDTVCMSDSFSLRQYFKVGMTSTEFETACLNLFKVGYFYDNQTKRACKIPASDQLGYWTPLMEVAVYAIPIIEKLKAATKTEICHTIILTDGDGNSATTYYDDRGNYTNMSFLNYEYIIADKISKKEYSVNAMDCQIYNPVLKLIADRTKANVIGFYITG